MSTTAVDPIALFTIDRTLYSRSAMTDDCEDPEGATAGINLQSYLRVLPISCLAAMYVELPPKRPIPHGASTLRVVDSTFHTPENHDG